MRTEHNKVRAGHKVRTEYKRISTELPAGGHRCTVPTQVIRRMDIRARSTESPASVPPVAKYLDMVRLWVPLDAGNSSEVGLGLECILDGGSSSLVNRFGEKMVLGCAL